MLRNVRFPILAGILFFAIPCILFATGEGNPDESEVKPPEERLDRSFKAINAQLRNAWVRLDNTTGDFAGKRKGTVVRGIQPTGITEKPVQQCCWRNMEKISERLVMIQVALADLRERFNAEENVQGNQAVNRMNGQIGVLKQALANLEGASSKEHAQAMFSNVKVAFGEMVRSKESLDHAMGRTPDGEAGG
jgi:hypothetical protein